MNLRFNEGPVQLEENQNPNASVSGASLDMPLGFENWSKEKQQEYLKNGESAEIPIENTEEEVSVLQIQRGLSSGSIALSATRKLEPYIGDRPNFRSESFSNLDQTQKDKIYLTVTSAINGAIKYLGWLKGKIITLVGESGISYENGEIKIGPDVNKEEILNYLEKISNDDKSNDIETVEDGSPNFGEGSEIQNKQEADKRNNFKEGDMVSWNYDGNTGQGRIISFGIPDSDPKVIVDVGSDGTVEVSLDRLSVVDEKELKEEKNALTLDKKEQEQNEVRSLDYTPEFKEYLGKQDANVGVGINDVSDEDIEKQNHQNRISAEGNLMEEQEEIKPVSSKNKIHSSNLIKQIPENQNEINPKIPNSELTPENPFTSKKDIVKRSNQVEMLGSEVIVGNKEVEVSRDEKVVDGEIILPQDLEKGSNVENNNIIDVEASEVKEIQEKEVKGLEKKEQSENFDIEKILDISDIKNSEEWKKFERMREDVARSDALGLDANINSIGVELNRSDYYGYKDILSKKIKESILEKAGNNLSEDQKFLLTKKINEATFDLLLKEENEIYNNTLSEHRNESFIKKGKEGVGKLLSTKAFEWYKSQSMGKKILISTALFAPIATIGAFATGGGASVALGATAYRGARVGFGMAGAKLGTVIADKGFEFGGNKLIWSEDEINKYEREKFAEIMDSEEDFETKSRKYDEVTQEVKKRRMDLAKTKAGLAVAGGVGAGIASGEAIESIVGAKTEAIFDPSLLNPTVQSGDSIWKIIENTLEANERFKNLTEAQKTFIVGFYNNNVLDNPNDFGVREGGNIMVGDKINLEKLFTNKNEFESFIDKVVKDIAPGSAREASILENNLKIKTWVKLNPDVRVTNEKVADILSGSPMKPLPNINDLDRSPIPNILEGSQVVEKIEPIETVRSEIPSKIEGSLGNETLDGSQVVEKIEPIETVKSEMPKELNENPQIVAEIQSEKIIPSSIEDISNQKLQEGVLSADIKTMNVGDRINNIETFSNRGINSETTTDPYSETHIDKDKLREEIEKDKQRLEALENNKGPKFSPNNIDLSAQIENAYLKEIDQIYGKKRFMGLLGNISGVDTPEYKFISRLPAVKVVEYYSGDSVQAGFPAEISKELAESEQHRTLWAQTDGLMKSVNGAVKPYQNENMGDYVRRLGGYVFRSHASKNI